MAASFRGLCGDMGDASLGALEVVVSNLLRAPREPKFRVLRLENASVREKLARCGAAMAFLGALGSAAASASAPPSGPRRRRRTGGGRFGRAPLLRLCLGALQKGLTLLGVFAHPAPMFTNKNNRYPTHQFSP